jgi:hypothetical protein
MWLLRASDIPSIFTSRPTPLTDGESCIISLSSEQGMLLIERSTLFVVKHWFWYKAENDSLGDTGTYVEG